MSASPLPSLRWAILGTARISRRGLIPGIRDSRSGQLLGLASRDKAKAEGWAKEFAIPRTYGDYQEALLDPEIDAVYLPLPNELHRPWTIAAADAGKHVLCEKPLALDADEAVVMADYCRSKGVVLMEAFMWPHQPRIQTLAKLVHVEGAIGPIRLVRGSFSFPIDPGDWRLDPARGGGALWDVGCYCVSAARLFTRAEPTEAVAQAHFVGGVDMTLSASLRFPGDVLASIDCSFEQPLRATIELVGDRGSIEVPDAFLPPEEGSRARILVKDGVNEMTFPAVNQYAAMVDGFAASVAAGRPVAPAEDGVAQMRAIDLVLKAAHRDR